MMKKILSTLGFGFFLLFSGVSWADTHVAASASRADVATAITAADYGDTVTIPACASGDCIWDTQINITKNIQIVGAGVDITYLTNGFDGATEEAFFSFVPDATSRNNLDSLAEDSATFSVTGITFTSATRVVDVFGVSISNQSLPVIKRVRIYGNKFVNIHRAMDIDGYVHGVFDSNTLVNSNAAYPQGVGSAHFANDRMTPGSGSGFYFEDNTISFAGNDALIVGAINDGYGIVMRYNTATGSLTVGSSYLETHGNQRYGIYGPQITEVYGNNITIIGAGRATNARGGKNIYFNNVFVKPKIWIWEEWSDAVTSATLPADKCVENQGVARQTCTDACICQKVHDSYFWNNRASETGVMTGAALYATAACGIAVMDCENRTTATANDPLEIVENTEFFNYNASFDGTEGVGCGVLAARPATCTTGVGYWVTTQSCSDLSGMVGVNPATPISGSLHKCTDTNTWTADYYVPYTYPHPLRSEGEGDVTAPQITAFVIPATATSLTVAITTFTATDATGVTGYCLNESAIPPTASACLGSGWEGSAQSDYTFASVGNKTLYAWAKDAAGNISASASDSVIIDVPQFGGVKKSGVKRQ